VVVGVVGQPFPSHGAFRAIERHAAPAIALAVADHEPAGAPGLAFTTAQRKAWRLTAHWRTNLRSVSEPEERGPGRYGCSAERTGGSVRLPLRGVAAIDLAGAVGRV
jgi:hypothetical protein